MRRTALAAAAGNRARHPTEPAGPTVVFADSFESGDFTAWGGCQWKGRNDDCQLYNGTSDYSATVVADGDRPQVARFEVRDGDVPPFGGGERSEITAPGVADVVANDERWISWDMFLDPDFPPPSTGNFFLVWQWHHTASDSGSPPVCLDINDAGHMIFANNDLSGYTRTDLGPIVTGVWRHYNVHVIFNEDPDLGLAEIWIDGALQSSLHRPTMVVGDPGCYFKMGLYRDVEETATAIIMHDNLRITAP